MKQTGLLLFLSLATSALFAEMVPNPGFESGERFAEQWQEGKLPADGSFLRQKNSRCSIVTLNGNRVLLMEGDREASDVYALVAGLRLPVVRGKSYEFGFSFRAEGLKGESLDRKQYAALIMDFFIDRDGKFQTAVRIMTTIDSPDWTLRKKRIPIPDLPGRLTGQIRFQLVNKYAGNPVRIWIDNVTLLPADETLANGGFEDGKDRPEKWEPFGSASCAWVNAPVRSGKKAVSVSDAPDGNLSGWSTIVPVRGDRQYRFSGMAKGGKLNPNGFIGGGALQIRFLDKSGNEVGSPVTSEAVPADSDWKRIATSFVRPPQIAFFARLTAGLQYCGGSAYFDDLELQIRPAEEKTAVRIKRDPRPSKNVVYAENLLRNGDAEQGTQGKVAHWTYHGKSEKDWSAEELRRLYDNGRPEFSVGRGRGIWSSDEKYAGNHSLLNLSIDPPLSPKNQWYGRNPVSGFWLSDPMPCEPGKAYLAGGWIKPGARITGAWFGPLHIEYYDRNGRKVNAVNHIRAAMEAEAGGWSYWATVPSIAPDGAVSMRLRFGQELNAQYGGWGMMYADNLAVWESPAGTKRIPNVVHNPELYWQWFREAHDRIKPPYLPSPAEAPAYQSVIGNVGRNVPGNLYREASRRPVKLNFLLWNLLGEDRKLRIETVRYDAFGGASPKVVSPEFSVSGSSLKTVELEFPATGANGAFYLDCTVMEGMAEVGRFSGRYAVLPPLNRTRTVENPFSVTTFAFESSVENNPFLDELMTCARIAGFGKVWVRCYVSDKAVDPKVFEQETAMFRKMVDYNRKFGMETILNINGIWPKGDPPRQVDKKANFQIGQNYGRVFGGRVCAFGNHGIEQSNSKSPYRGGGKSRLTDFEYDTIMACVYDGIKSVAPDALVCIGNIATDFEADTVKRLYKSPGNGKFDGAFFNAYMGQLVVGRNMLAVFDSHGDTEKTIWSEEQANQRSPFEGPARRYGEILGAERMVQTWISMIGRLGPRLKSVTMWGFAPSTRQDIMMMTPDLQPRPQFVAHAVMADFLADALFTGDRSAGGINLFEWKRPDGPAFICWADAGKRSLNLEVPSGSLILTDIMGNSVRKKAGKGIVALELDGRPVFLSGGGAVRISDRIRISVFNGTRRIEKPELGVLIQNNSGEALSGKLQAAGREIPVEIGKNGSRTFHFPLPRTVEMTRRNTWKAVFTGKDGTVYTGTGTFLPLCAVKASVPPALDGSWKGWERAGCVQMGLRPEERAEEGAGDEKYRGPEDLQASFRLMWDADALYLGVETGDDVFLPQKGRNNGFMGDSIEFAFQPEGVLNNSAAKYEYEMFLPDGEKEFVLSRRFPAPSGEVAGWRGIIRKPGVRGNAVYQIAIPWSALKTKAFAGKRMSFSLVVNDKDLSAVPFSGKRTSFLFFDGINAKDPSKYGDLLLTE